MAANCSSKNALLLYSPLVFNLLLTGIILTLSIFALIHLLKKSSSNFSINLKIIAASMMCYLVLLSSSMIFTTTLVLYAYANEIYAFESIRIIGIACAVNSRILVIRGISYGGHLIFMALERVLASWQYLTYNESAKLYGIVCILIHWAGVSLFMASANYRPETCHVYVSTAK